MTQENLTAANPLLANLQDNVQSEIQSTGFDANKENLGGGDFERIILEAGIYPGYLVEYVDFGTQQFKGFAGGKDTFHPAVHLGVAVFDFKQDGSYEYVILGTHTSFPLKVSLNPKAKYRKIFQAFNYADDPNIKHFAQLIGPQHSFNFKVTKEKTKDGKREYNRIELESATPCFVGSRGQQQRDVLPEIDPEDFAVLLWNSPTMDQWKSIQRGADGISPLDPKNFYQYKVLQATDFKGSMVEHLLAQNGVDYHTPPQAEEDTTQAAMPVEEAPEATQPAQPSQPAQPVVPEMPTPVAPQPALPSIPGQEG